MGCAATVLQGTQPTVTFQFRDLDSGLLADPSEVYVRVEGPGGVVAEYTTPSAHIVNVSTGVWRFTFPNIPPPGTWKVYGAGTAGVIAAAETSIAVKSSKVALAP